MRCTGSGTVTFVADDFDGDRRKLKQEEEEEGKTTSKLRGASTSTSSSGGKRKLLQAFELEGVMMTINVVGDVQHLEPNLKPFSVNRPCYVMDTRNLIPDQFFKLDFFLRTINNEKFIDQLHYINTQQPFLTGQLIEVELTGMSLHVRYIYRYTHTSKVVLTSSCFPKNIYICI